MNELELCLIFSSLYTCVSIYISKKSNNMRKLSNIICLLGAIIGSLFGIYYVFNPTIYISNLLLINIITMLITDTITGFLNYFTPMKI